AVARDHGERGQEVVERWWRRWMDPAFRRWDVSACLPLIRCPVLVVHGARDIFFPISHSETIAARIPRSAFRLIPDAGHTPHLETPDVFNDELIAFLVTGDW
ncbi:MAG: alpha/beta hydrolase, partial [Anaerolineae bacterium]|nr:alpha/beta hydrolase [Caldilineales bacterium]MDW8270772.1 alpha/beta hydrolase [Anaerolineae bacterium]